MSPEIVENIPTDSVELVYWDYYHTNSEVYAQKIQDHRDLGCHNPWVAGGIWTWNRFWAHLPFTFQATRGCMQASKRKNGVKNIMATVWGDDGNECETYVLFSQKVIGAEF
jgi:hypothetical protein